MLDIRLYGDAVLRQKSKPIEKLTASIRRLSAQMIESMRKAVGVGLAAPQVGKNIQVVVLHHPEFHPKPLTLINPVILDRSKELTSLEEGCLSIPDLSVPVARPRAIRVRYTDLTGKVIEREFLDLLSRIVQHECDHLSGKLIVDHLDLEKRLKFETKFKKMFGVPSTDRGSGTAG